jgi:iron(III) transport system substrate-binding protein
MRLSRRVLLASAAALPLLATTLLATTDALAASGELTIYTSQPNEDAQATVDAFQALHPDVEVSWIRDGTVNVMAKLRAEIAAGAPEADVLLIADTVTMESLKQEDLLLAHPDADVAAYDAGLYDADMTYFSTKLITTGLVHNNDAPEAPTSWKDLEDPAMQGLIAMPSPLTSGAALIHLATMVEHSDFGWEHYEALAKNGVQPQGGNGATFQAVAGGEKLYGVVIDYLPIREAAKGSPVTFVFPEEGVSAVTEPVAILSATDNPEAAKAFVDFLLSRDGQELAASQGYLAAHPEVASPEGFPPLSEITLMPFDAAKALENDTVYKERFSELFGG